MRDFDPSPDEGDLNLTDMDDPPRESTAPFNQHPSLNASGQKPVELKDVVIEDI